jgi:hypothetical protein
MKKNLKDNNWRELKVNELYQVTGGYTNRLPNVGNNDMNYFTGVPSSGSWICPNCGEHILVKDVTLHISSCKGND